VGRLRGQQRRPVRHAAALGIPVVSDFNWWSHSVCTLDLIDVDPADIQGSIRTRIWNSWSRSWSDDGEGELKGRKAIPNSHDRPPGLRGVRDDARCSIPGPIVRVRVPMMPYRRPDGVLVQPEFRPTRYGAVLGVIPGVDTILFADDLADAINEYTELAERSRSANPAT
jgi:hypothetical protein